MSTADVLVNLVDLMLPRGNRDQALYVPLELSLGRMSTRSMALAMFIYRPTAYTLVATRYDRLSISRRQEEVLALECYHDSAWRQDGIRDVLDKACDQLAAKLPPGEACSTPMAEFIGLGGLGVYPVERVDFDSTDRSKPVVVRWRQGD